MRRKLVLWGSNDKDEKLLVALELLEKENVVNLYTFSEQIATESFYKEISEKWKDDTDIEFPAGYTKIERKLSVTDSLLPDEIRVERPDLITRAQAEWHFVVLSSKLYGMYKAEVEELKEKIDSISEYDNILWDELRSFWDKVQGQVNEKNLFREQGAALREKTNHLFDKLKKFRKGLEEEFATQSKKHVEFFHQEIASVEERIEKGLGHHPLFEDLKKIQAKLRDFKFTKKDRDEVWNKIDKAFKKLKDNKGAQSAQYSNNNLARLQSRYDGLIGAIHKMQKSIDFDQKDLDYQAKRVADSDGQLESQLRQAKIKMIEERVKSKQEKIDDMHATKKDLENKLEREKKRAVKAEHIEKVEEAKEVVKQKIASGISENTKELDKQSDKLEKAAHEIVTPKKESFFDKLSESIEQAVEDVVDSAKAVAEVMGDKIEDAMDKAKDMAEDFSDKAEDVLDNAKDIAEDIAEKSYDKAKVIMEDISESSEKAIKKAKESAEIVKEKVADLAENMADTAEDAFDNAKEIVEDIVKKSQDKAEDIAEDVTESAEESVDKAVDIVEDIKDQVEEKLADDSSDEDKEIKES